jgi:hypothetical protein
METVLDIPLEALKIILDKNLKEIEKNERKETLDEYVFIPIINQVRYEYKGQNLILNKNNANIIEINILDNAKHITRIYYDGDKLDIRNILVLTGYIVDENSLGLVQTLDPCDHVKGILINGKVTSLHASLSIQEIMFSKENIMDKLYLLRKTSRIDFQNDVKINLITTSKIVRKASYNSLQNVNKEKLKEGLKGIFDLYGVGDEKNVNKLLEKLIDIVWYHSI